MLILIKLISSAENFFVADGRYEEVCVISEDWYQKRR
jgi:hypothetical protein